MLASHKFAHKTPECCLPASSAVRGSVYEEYATGLTETTKAAVLHQNGEVLEAQDSQSSAPENSRCEGALERCYEAQDFGGRYADLCRTLVTYDGMGLWTPGRRNVV